MFLDREAVAGDPSAWSRACASLEAVRAAVKPRGAHIVVAVVQVGVTEDKSSYIVACCTLSHKCVQFAVQQRKLAALRPSVSRQCRRIDMDLCRDVFEHGALR